MIKVTAGNEVEIYPKNDVVLIVIPNHLCRGIQRENEYSELQETVGGRVGKVGVIKRIVL